MRHIPLLLTFLTATVLPYSLDECEGDFCPPSPLAPRLLFFGTTLGPLVGEDKELGCYHRELVEEFALWFGRSRCTAIPRGFRVKSSTLKLTNTHIKTLRAGDFQALSHLMELQIEGNYDLESILGGTFAPLNNLRNLSIAFNTKLRFIEKGAFDGLRELEHLFLNKNGFQRIYDFTSGLSAQVAPKLITLVADSNNITQITIEDFRFMANSTLEELSLNRCRIEYIHPRAFISLGHLHRLRLGENSISSDVLMDALNNMINNGIRLDFLDLFAMDFKKSPPRELMKVIAKSNVSKLNLSMNQFEIIDENTFPKMPNLHLLDLRKVQALQITDDAFANLPSLRTLLINGNRLTQIPKGVLTLEKLQYLDIKENSPGIEFHVYFTHEEWQFVKMTNLIYLNLAFNGLSHLYNNSFTGLNSLKVLILMNSSLFHIDYYTFSALKELKILNMMNNMLVHGDAVPDVFFAQTKLEVLILSGCKFKYISKYNNPFRNLISLKHLLLDKNQLKAISSTDFQPLKSVTTIDLAYNLITSWDERIFTNNTNLTRIILSKNKLTDITVAMLEDFVMIDSIDMDQNAILCKCFGTYKSYRTWFSLTNNNNLENSTKFDPPIYCGYPDELDNITLLDYLTKQEYGKSMCSSRFDKFYLLLPLIGTLAFFAALGFLIFWYRWHIKYWIFLSKLYLSRRGKIKPNNQKKKSYCNFEYDAFVSYSTEDRDFVIKLVAMMENQEPYLKLCVYERDFQIGTIISESVLESVAKSRKTVLVISDNYAKSQWCRWESQICEHHRLFLENEDGEYVDDSLVLIRLSPVSESYLTPTLKYLLKTRIYLQWGWDEKKQEMFWTRLRNTLGPPIAQGEITHI